jgi:Rrf2 family protein
MFTLTKKTDYGIIALSHLAKQPVGTVTTAREIAERYHVPAALLVNVLKALCQGELVRSTRGVKGGYTLALQADEISLAEIIRVIDGPVRFVQCSDKTSDGESACELLGTCPVVRPIHKVHAKLVSFLNDVKLSDIAFDEAFGDNNDKVALSLSGLQHHPEHVI